MWLYLSFQWRDFPENLCLGPNENSEYQKLRMVRLVCDYIDAT